MTTLFLSIYSSIQSSHLLQTLFSLDFGEDGRRSLLLHSLCQLLSCLHKHFFLLPLFSLSRPGLAFLLRYIIIYTLLVTICLPLILRCISFYPLIQEVKFRCLCKSLTFATDEGEKKTSRSVSLNCSLRHLLTPLLSRKTFSHILLSFNHTLYSITGRFIKNVKEELHEDP